MMEMNMSNIEHDEDIVDLGAASVETQGAIRGVLDLTGGQLNQMGIADD
jgi:hypothetical protein